MITFSKQSWHYRLYFKVYGKYPPTSICPYFWKLIWAIIFHCFLMWAAIAFFVTGMFVASLGILSMPAIGTSIFIGDGSANTLWGLPLYHWKVIIFDVLCWSSLLGFIYLISLCKIKKESSLVIEWVKAKKQRICPLIKFKE